MAIVLRQKGLTMPIAIECTLSQTHDYVITPKGAISIDPYGVISGKKINVIYQVDRFQRITVSYHIRLHKGQSSLIMLAEDIPTHFTEQFDAVIERVEAAAVWRDPFRPRVRFYATHPASTIQTGEPLVFHPYVAQLGIDGVSRWTHWSGATQPIMMPPVVRIHQYPASKR